jgi:GntR family transcriptional regulator
MLLRIDFESDTPIYIQLKNQLIEGIARGELKQGDSLPSVRQLAEDIGINMHTVNKAYALLKDDGFVSLDRRKGAIIAKIEPFNEKYIERLKEEISTTAAEAYCKNVNEELFLKICSDIYRSFREEKDNGR